MTDGYVAIARDPQSGRHFILTRRTTRSGRSRSMRHAGSCPAIRWPSLKTSAYSACLQQGHWSRDRRRPNTRSSPGSIVGGKPLGTLGPVDDYWGIQLSPDNKRAAVVRHRALNGYFAIWLIDVARDLPTPFSLESERSMAPAWSPDSRRVYFRRPAERTRSFSKPQTMRTPSGW